MSGCVENRQGGMRGGAHVPAPPRAHLRGGGRADKEESQGVELEPPRRFFNPGPT